MKILFSLLFVLFFTAVNGQTKDTLSKEPDASKELMTVQTACGQCKFGLKGDGCTLAVRIKGKGAYFVEGTDIDDHGDAHAKDGFCNSIRKAQVQGEIINDRFKVTYFKLVKQ